MKWFSAGAAVVVVAAWAWTHHARAVNEHALAVVAGELAGRPVQVHCQGFFGHLVDVSAESGYVPYDASGVPKPETELKKDVCDELEHFRTSSRHPELDCLLAIDWSRWTFADDFDTPCSVRANAAAEAINTLTHESMHMHGWTSESQAQCYAIQEDAWTTAQLGGTLAEGKAVANYVLAIQPGLPSEYQSTECRAGGSLDLHPQTPDFPTEAMPVLSLPPGPVR